MSEQTGSVGELIAELRRAIMDPGTKNANRRLLGLSMDCIMDLTVRLHEATKTSSPIETAEAAGAIEEPTLAKEPISIVGLEQPASIEGAAI